MILILKKKYKFLLLPLFILFQILFSSNTIIAQNISLDQDWRIDKIRREQLLGLYDSTQSFLINPFKQRNKTGINILEKFAYIDYLPIQFNQQYTSSIPFKLIDGPMLSSSGYQSMFSIGFYSRIGPLNIQIQPQFVSAQNKSNFNNYQSNPFNKIFFGNSSVKLKFGKFSIGVSSENLSWGPSVFNPLLMSAHSPGFLHASFNTNEPINTPIGDFEWQFIGGYLESQSSKYQNVVDYNFSTIEGRRYLNALIFSYHPKWLDGLHLGVIRAVQEPEILLKDLSNWNMVFKNISRSNDKKQFSDYLLKSVEDYTDQYGDVFLRYLFKNSNAEFYFEWGRNDAFFNLRDAIQRLDHSRAYTLGFRKLFGISEFKTKYWQFLSEYTTLQQPPSWPLLSAGEWYGHGLVIQGYTHLGEFLGAPIGQGGSAQTIRLSRINSIKQYSIQIEKVNNNGDYFENYLAFSNASLNKWVDYNFSLSITYPIKNLIFNSSIAYKKALNYNWKQSSTASGLGLNNPNDLSSFMFKLGIWFR